MFKKLLQLKTLLVALLVMAGAGNVWADEVTYTVTSTSAVSISGNAPTGSSAKYSSTYSTATQLTSGNSMTLTLSGYAGKKITGLVLSMKSNSKGGAGNLSVKAGNTTIASIATAAFNTSSWNNSWSTSYVDKVVTISNDSYVIQNDEDVVITIAATANSLYCESFKLTYEGGGDTPILETSDLKLSAGSLSFDLYDERDAKSVSFTTSSTGAVTVSESEYVTTSVSGNTITVTPVKVTPSPQTITVSQAADDTYAAKTVTFTVKITDSTPFSGGDVTFTCGTETSTGSSITKNGVTLSTTSGTWSRTDNYRVYANNSLTVSTTSGKITKIQFTISQNNFSGDGYNATTNTWIGSSESVTLAADGGQVRFTPVVVTITSADAVAEPEISYSQTEYNVTLGESFEAPSLTNPNNLAVTYSSMDASVATVNESTGAVTIKGVGTTIITANFAGNDTYKPGTASYTLVVSPSTPVGVVVWKEDWSEFGADETPAVSGNASYVYTNGNSDTKLYDENYAGGSKPELLINRSGGAFAATIPLFGAYGNMTLSLKANKPLSVKAKVDDEDNVTLKNSGDDTSQIYTIDVPDVATQIVITLTNNSTDSNVRVDDFLLIAPQVGVRIGAAGYSTMYYGSSNLVVPADVVVRTYKVNNGELETSIEYTEGDVLAKAQGYVIKGTAGTYTFTATKNDASVDANNQLRGSDVAVTTTGGTYYYGLSLNAASEPQSVGFYWMEDNGAAFTNGAHKAYLALNDQFASGSAVRGFLLNGTNTGVETLPHESMRSGIVYDLQGRRVNNPGSGLYIINGQKVFNK